MNNLAGRHAVVTGGGRGIGAAIAQMLDAQGATTTLVGRDEAALAAQANALSDAHYARLDITDSSAVRRVFDGLHAPVDILVNNAGSAPSAPFAKMTEQAWHDTLNVNLTGAFYCCRAAINSMLDRGYGRIINIASTSALRGYSYVAAYCAAKHGLLGLTRALAVEYAKHEITVNAICPGFTETDLLTTSVANIMEKTGRSEEAARKVLLADNPQQRFITPEEVAATVSWLVSDGARSVTGQAIAVCGGEV